MAQTKIEWTERVWNPLRGCSRVSEGCRHCYAERMAARFSGPGQPYEGLVRSTGQGPRWTGKVVLAKDKLMEPLTWRKPSVVFVNSMSDLFHESVPDEWIDKVFAVMALAQHHTFQVLTKRPERMLRYFEQMDDERDMQRWCNAAAEIANSPCAPGIIEDLDWPLPNVWLGVSVENQEAADERIPLLLQTPAAVRFVSCEPLLGPVDLSSFPPFSWEPIPEEVRVQLQGMFGASLPADSLNAQAARMRLDWVIVGGESGPGARPCHPDWVRALRDQCLAAQVPFFFKQWGQWVPLDHYADHYSVERLVAIDGEVRLEYAGYGNDHDRRWVKVVKAGKGAAGRMLDGRTWDEMPGSTERSG